MCVCMHTIDNFNIIYEYTLYIFICNNCMWCRSFVNQLLFQLYKKFVLPLLVNIQNAQ